MATPLSKGDLKLISGKFQHAGIRRLFTTPQLRGLLKHPDISLREKAYAEIMRRRQARRVN